MLDENLLLGLFTIIFIVQFYLINQINSLKKNNLKNVENFDNAPVDAITNLGLLADSILKSPTSVLTIPAKGIKIGSTGYNIGGFAFGTTSGASTAGIVSVRFDNPFPSIPSVVANVNYGGVGYILCVLVHNITTTGFQYNIFQAGANPPSHFEVHSGITWIAMCGV
jgi:hypothetical protein